jgi:hypothetical protein
VTNKKSFIKLTPGVEFADVVFGIVTVTVVVAVVVTFDVKKPLVVVAVVSTTVVVINDVIVALPGGGDDTFELSFVDAVNDVVPVTLVVAAAAAAAVVVERPKPVLVTEFKSCSFKLVFIELVSMV